MESVKIIQCGVDEFKAQGNLDELFTQYAAESAIEGLGVPHPRMDIYEKMEASGALHTFIAIANGEMVGFLSFLVTVLPHYGQVVATSESFFVVPEYRKGGAGLKMLRFAEAIAKNLGAVGFFLSSPCGGRLAGIAPRLGYEPTNEVFFKCLT